ncbi:glycosyl transferase family 1 [Phenylobacterium sp.]|uniref:glycosyl transferase family 1 n=1 Tax=Phenylobacterium sp. TaxID=1871053 RepID=UPI00378398EF
MKIAYFVHDLADPAVARRLSMLRAGGAEPVVLGFRRTEGAPGEVAGVRAIDLGRTYDGRLGHRARTTALAALGAGRWRGLLAGADAVMGRTLEALATAEAARRLAGVRAPLIYECLDIHRLMLGEGRAGRTMRAVERALLRRCALLIVSSPAFLREYFEPRQGVGRSLPIRTLLVENKALELSGGRPRVQAQPLGPPWRIGWMGAIRCRRSLQILTDLAARRPDLVEVRIHGRPAYTEFDDFDAQVARLPNVAFLGAYTAEDLPRLYGDVHFSWAIDYMEAGQNSAWLLPNRLYESGRYGAAPIALSDVETGRYLAARRIGVRLDDPSELEGVLERMTNEAWRRLRAEIDAVPQETFVAGEADCRRLVNAVAGRAADAQDDPSPAPRLVA